MMKPYNTYYMLNNIYYKRIIYIIYYRTHILNRMSSSKIFTVLEIVIAEPQLSMGHFGGRREAHNGSLDAEAPTPFLAPSQLPTHPSVLG